MSGNAFGQTSRLSVVTGLHGGRTVLEHLEFTAPFKIMRPFYPPGRMQLMLMTASAGILAGDRQEMRFLVRRDSRAELISQACEKLHNMDGGQASRTVQLTVETGGLLVWHPQPVIPFAGAAFRAELQAELEPGARLVLADILTCGRKAGGELFAYRSFENLVCVRRAGRLIYRDACRFLPAQMDMQGFGLYEGFSHLMNLQLFGFGTDQADALRQCLAAAGSAGIRAALTRLQDGDLAVRAFGQNAQSLQQLQDSLLETAAVFET